MQDLDARRLADALAPAVVHLTIRAVGVAVLGLMARVHDTPLVTELRSWDGVWMLSIARYGYDDVPVTLVDALGRHTADTAYAFFPGYPAAIAAVGLLTSGNLVVAALLATNVAGVAAAYGLVRLAEVVPGGSRRAGLLLVALFAAAPMGVVLSMAYTEALFCALAVWALVGVLRGQWLLAGLCSAAAGLVRPTGSAPALAVGVAAVVAVVQRRDGVRPWLGGLLAVTGSIVLLVVAVRMRLPWPLPVYTAAVLIIAVGERRADPLTGAVAHAGVPAAAAGRPRARAPPDRHGGRGDGRGDAGLGLVRRLRADDLALRDLTGGGPRTPT